MKSIKGTKTEKNLLASFAGESQARNRYTYFASVAKKAGFEVPILHGLASYGIAARAVLKSMDNGDATELQSFGLRFSAPVYPGETIRTDVWKDGNIVSFRASVVERDVVGLKNGRAEIGPGDAD